MSLSFAIADLRSSGGSPHSTSQTFLYIDANHGRYSFFAHGLHRPQVSCLDFGLVNRYTGEMKTFLASVGAVYLVVTTIALLTGLWEVRQRPGPITEKDVVHTLGMASFVIVICAGLVLGAFLIDFLWAGVFHILAPKSLLYDN